MHLGSHTGWFPAVHPDGGIAALLVDLGDETWSDQQRGAHPPRYAFRT